MLIELSPEKHPDERWAITIDMSARLDRTERIDLVEGNAYLVARPRVVREYDTENADEITFLVRKGKNTTSMTTLAQNIGPKCTLLVQEKTLIEDSSVWDPSGIIIDETEGKTFQVVLQGGAAGRRYMLDLNVHTDKGFIHKLFLIWGVES